MSVHGLPAPPEGGFKAILADPPWAFSTYSKPAGSTPHRTANEPYGVMSLGAIKALPVAEIAATDCVLFLWVVDSHLKMSFEVGEAWGFTYKTRAFEWVKPGIGMGYWTRKQAESCLLFTRGSPGRKSKGVRQVIDSRRQAHSQKPDQVYDRIEALVEGPYCELFARRRRIGWFQHGDELPDGAEEAVRRMTYWMDLLGVDEGPDGDYRLCEKGHPAVRTSRGEEWPYCDDNCAPYY